MIYPSPIISINISSLSGHVRVKYGCATPAATLDSFGQRRGGS